MPGVSKSRKLTHADVAAAYAIARVHGGAPADHLDGRSPLRAIGAAIIDGVVGHSGRVENGWLTEKGVALLDDSLRNQYREAVRRKTLVGA